MFTTFSLGMIGCLAVHVGTSLLCDSGILPGIAGALSVIACPRGPRFSNRIPDEMSYVSSAEIIMSSSEMSFTQTQP